MQLRLESTVNKEKNGQNLRNNLIQNNRLFRSFWEFLHL